MNEAVPVSRLQPILKNWANDRNVNEAICELAKASGVTVRTVKAVFRDHVETVDVWTADRLLVATGNVTLWLTDLSDLYFDAPEPIAEAVAA